MAAAKRQALGRGLSALLSDPENEIQSVKHPNADKVVGNVIELELDKITVNPFQPRTHFNEATLKELADSIKQLGVIQPITVRKLKEGGFQLISGERRFRAAKLAGLDTLPTFVRLADDQESLEMALVENIQREDLDPIEIALTYERLIEEINLTQEQLSERVGQNRTTISNYMRLLKLDPIIQTGIRDGFLSMGHGKALINVENRSTQLEIYEKVVAKGLSVRATEELVKKQREGSPAESIPSPTSPLATQVEEDLAAHLNLSVTVQVNAKGKGTLRIPFNSSDDLEQIVNKIKGVS